jgi:hypothetical protein
LAPPAALTARSFRDVQVSHSLVCPHCQPNPFGRVSEGGPARHTASERGLDEEAFFEELQRIQQKMAAARRELDEAQAFPHSRQMAWGRLTSAIDGTRDLAAT